MGLGVWRDGWVLIRNGKELHPGDKVKTFRGEKFVLTGGRPPQHEGSTGRVYVQDKDGEREYFPSVIDAEWVRGGRESMKVVKGGLGWFGDFAGMVRCRCR